MTTTFTNLSSRVAVAAIGIPVILLAAYFGSIWFFLLVAGIAILSLKEFYNLAKAKGALPQTGIGIAGILFLHLAFFHEQIQYSVLPLFFGAEGISLLTKLQLLLTIFFILLTVIFIYELFRNAGSIFLNAGFTILGVVYIGLFLSSLVGIRELFGDEFPLVLAMQSGVINGSLSSIIKTTTYSWGGATVVSIFASIWICDTAAYFGGLSMGKHKLFPRVSPKKSWEGAIWGFFGAVATMIVAQKFFLPYLAFHQAVIMGILIGVFGQLGDLVESLFKRDAGVKDSSAIIPGHGGVLDRFDSLIFVSPILYLYIDFVVLS
ncbi:MAG: phosphatidate cytidylyltransferase [Bacteroidetes bacterium]|nr:phosphatidate cytidylyltransferase [Bacteroidota bacterium]